MSYTIERGSRVLSLKTADPRFSPGIYEETLIFLHATADNNVHPRTYDWNVLATGQFSGWGGEIQVPSKIWELGEAADGGSIQPYGKFVSGLSYVKSWKQAVKGAAGR